MIGLFLSHVEQANVELQKAMEVAVDIDSPCFPFLGGIGLIESLVEEVIGLVAKERTRAAIVEGFPEADMADIDKLIESAITVPREEIKRMAAGVPEIIESSPVTPSKTRRTTIYMELFVLQHYADGMGKAEIARKLSVSRNRVASILSRYGVKSREDAHREFERSRIKLI